MGSNKTTEERTHKDAGGNGLENIPVHGAAGIMRPRAGDGGDHDAGKRSAERLG